MLVNGLIFHFVAMIRALEIGGSFFASHSHNSCAEKGN
jgi:hypothetical protein